MNNTIEIKGLKKRYDNFELGEINLNINSGYIKTKILIIVMLVTAALLSLAVVCYLLVK